MTERFTPGPWEAHTFQLTSADRKHRLAHFGPISGKLVAASTRESEANCLLAAAAPELFEAADHMLVAHESESATHYSAAIAKLRTALAKARGGE